MFEELYLPCVMCAEPCADVLNANTQDVDTRYIPRGFYSDTAPGHPALMFLAMNPGGGKRPDSLLEDPGLYDGQPPAEILRLQRAFIDAQFARPRRGYHRKLPLQAAAFLGVRPEDAMRFVVLTELFKCTTPGDGMASRGTVDRCVERHLSRELEAWKPLAIVPLGDAVRNYIAARTDLFAGIAIVHLTHPSYYGRTDAEFVKEAAAAFSSLPKTTQDEITARLPVSKHRNRGAEADLWGGGMKG